jgi:hypothetical protein
MRQQNEAWPPAGTLPPSRGSIAVAHVSVAPRPFEMVTPRRWSFPRRRKPDKVVSQNLEVLQHFT